MKGPIKMQDNYFKFCQTSFKDVYSLTLRKFLYPWLFPELAATMNHASGIKLLVELVPTDPKYFLVLFPVCSTQEYVKHLKSLLNKTSSVFKSNVHQGNPKWWTKFKKKICKIRRFGVISLQYPSCFIFFVSPRWRQDLPPLILAQWSQSCFIH